MPIDGYHSKSGFCSISCCCDRHICDIQDSVILQKSVPVHDEDTAVTLSARILEQEHRAYPEAIAAVLSGEYSVQERRYLRRKP